MPLTEIPTGAPRAHATTDPETLRAHHRAELKAAIVGLWVVGALAAASLVVFAVLASGFGGSGGADAAALVLPVAVIVFAVLAVAGVRLVRVLRRAEPPRFDSVAQLHDALDPPAR